MESELTMQPANMAELMEIEGGLGPLCILGVAAGAAAIGLVAVGLAYAFFG